MLFAEAEVDGRDLEHLIAIFMDMRWALDLLAEPRGRA
jgi:hypothetical protein